MDKVQAIDFIIDSVIISIFSNGGIETDEERQMMVQLVMASIVELIKPEYEEEFIKRFVSIMDELVDLNKTTQEHFDEIMNQLDWKKNG